MNPASPEHTHATEYREHEPAAFLDKMRELLPSVDFEETVELREARAAVLEALKPDQNPDLLQAVWTEYANICEQFVDNQAETQTRAQLQIAILVHKALIFREIEDVQRYGEELTDAGDYAFNAYLDDIAEAIGAELDKLQS